MTTPGKARHPMVSEQAWKQVVASAPPSRDDDTVVLSGGHRATLDEFIAHVEADSAARLTESQPSG